MGKKVRCIKGDTVFSLVEGEIYEVTKEFSNGYGDFYKIKGQLLHRHVERFEEVKEEPKYPIITTHMGEKVVFNPPYTIVICNLTSGAYKGQKLIGKAKCHPTDTYDKWTGYVIAHERMTKATPCTK